ncbi:MAG: hypothetical protein ABI824_16470 [Acidobacteriota bacterium]
MERMSNFSPETGNDKLSALFVQYREACPDVDAGADFMPGLWQRIESRRKETTFVFRRLAQICVMATAVLAILITGVLMPASSASDLFYSSSYAEVIAADHVANDYIATLPLGDYAR